MFGFKGDDDDDGKHDKFGKYEADFLHQMLNDPSEPTQDDVGHFLTEDELQEWWSVHKKKYPQVFEADDPLFGAEGAQYAFGTKLMSDPFRVRVLGSKWIPDYPPQMARILQYSSKTPYYVIKHKGAHSYDLSIIEVGSAHEGNWHVGWEDVDDTDEHFNSLEELVRSREKPQDKESDGKDEEVSMEEHVVAWNSTTDGSFAEAFRESNFTYDELESYGCGDKVTTDQSLTSSSPDYTKRALLMNIVLAYTQEDAGGVILANERHTKFQVIEFNGPGKLKDEPVIDISYANSPGMDDAESFLRGEKIKVMTCSDEVARAIESHCINHSSGEGLNDIGSGLLIFEGYLTPMKPTTTSRDGVSNGFAQIPDGTFGIEFELSCAIGSFEADVAKAIEDYASVKVKIEPVRKRYPLFSYSDKKGKADANNDWTLCHDGSIKTRSDLPNSTKFELVSPILRGEQGLRECKLVLGALTDTSAIQVNKSMGLHVHVGVQNFPFDDIKRISQNFVKYEDVMDTFMPPSRRTDSNKFCQSNKTAVLSQGSMTKRHEIIESCSNSNQLFEMMNPGGRYYKLNLNNLKTGKRPTIEFRQHSATSDYRKVEPWVRFCMAFVHNSVRLQWDGSLKECQDIEEKFGELFRCIIQDEALREHYKLRREKLQLHVE